MLSLNGWRVLRRASWKRRWQNREEIFTDTLGRFVCALRNRHGETFWTEADELDWNAEKEICKTCIRATGRLRWRNGEHPYIKPDPSAEIPQDKTLGDFGDKLLGRKS